MNPTAATSFPVAATDPRWRAVLDRADLPDLYYAVTTTGIYCRPRCAARRPKLVNVRFFDAPAAAERAGYRPCKRCRPDAVAARHDDNAARIAAVCRRLENAATAPPLAELAAAAGLSPYHFHRLFKKATGVTPKAYASACRQRRLQRELQTQTRITDACYDAGFGAASRFYDQAERLLGMTPSAYKNGAPGARLDYAVADCCVGKVLVAVGARGVCAVELGDQDRTLCERLRERFPHAELIAAGAEFAATMRAVVAAIDSPGRDSGLPLDIQGTAFQHRVWQALRAIAPGQTASYSELARRIDRPNAARAVARACAANTLAVLIPCHRAVRADGASGGYRWGESRKRRLLEIEARRRPRAAAADAEAEADDEA